jgi:hypothetical protein
MFSASLHPLSWLEWDLQHSVRVKLFEAIIVLIDNLMEISVTPLIEFHCLPVVLFMLTVGIGGHRQKTYGLVPLGRV